MTYPDASHPDADAPPQPRKPGAPRRKRSPTALPRRRAPRVVTHPGPTPERPFRAGARRVRRFRARASVVRALASRRSVSSRRDVLVEEFCAVSAALFCLVEGSVRRRVQACRDAHAGSPRCDADARGQVEVDAAGHERGIVERAANPVSGDHRLLGGGLREQRDEFLAAVAADRVGLAACLAKPRRGFAEHRIARRMPVAVIDRFEVIDIDHRARERAVIASGVCDRGRGARIELSTVEQPGERVASRVADQIVAERLRSER